MSFKTERLVKLFPDAYGARDRETLLYKLLDTQGAAFLEADQAVKKLLKSHWVDYAAGPGLDGLGAVFGVSRRRHDDGTPEDDEAFRKRLKSTVPLFKGGGTRSAVLGAVRSALGLPYDLDAARLPAGLKQDLEGLIRLNEFTPELQRVVGTTPEGVADRQRLILVTEIPSVLEESPRIDWTMTNASGRRLSVTQLDSVAGFRSKDSFVLAQGQTLSLFGEPDGSLSARVGVLDVTSEFTDLDGVSPPRMPPIPLTRAEWEFAAQSGLWDLSIFDETEGFDIPLFRVEMSWYRRTPLTFEVVVPYFLREAVERLKQLHGYTGDLFVFEGLPLEVLQQVVNQTKAAGVLGTIHLSLNFSEDHEAPERFALQGNHRVVEDAGASEALRIGSVSRFSESHDVVEGFVVGGVWDISTFDGDHGFV